MQIILDSHFADLDLFRESVDGWDLDFRLMQRGGFRGAVLQLAHPDILLGRARFRCGLAQRGATPAGFRTFGIPGQSCRFWSRGRQYGPDELLLYPSSNEIASVTSVDFDIYAVSLTETLIDELCETLGVRWVGETVEAVRPTRAQMSRLRRTAEQACCASSGSQRTRLAQSVAEQLVVCFSTAESPGRPRLRSRDRVVQRIVDHLHQGVGDIPNAAEMCRIACASERTLQYAIRERFGVSPNEFVRFWRLNDARRMLLDSESPGEAIAAVAERCGFRNPSVFAREFKLLHGELPSTTRARGYRSPVEP
jgi:AraC family ethanolamine operon transcriptional activator